MLSHTLHNITNKITIIYEINFNRLKKKTLTSKYQLSIYFFRVLWTYIIIVNYFYTDDSNRPPSLERDHLFS
jgi:hypothetical protein